VGISVRVASSDGGAIDQDEASAILARADEALYSAKSQGRNRYEFAETANGSESLCA
jgi:PleD family two-component response regulator